MEHINATALHLELYRMAVGQPGKGRRALERAHAICQAFYEDDPGIHLLERLRSLQELMSEWNGAGGRQVQGDSLTMLREQLIECIDEIVELTATPDDHMAPPLAAAAGHAPARIAYPQ